MYCKRREVKNQNTVAVKTTTYSGTREEQEGIKEVKSQNAVAPEALEHLRVQEVRQTGGEE
jgi:hypothetical protein